MAIENLILIDYGMGNLGSVGNALRFLGQETRISSDPVEIAEADAYILPGVGAFGEAMIRLDRLRLIDALAEQVIAKCKPLLGICLGMQLLAEDSYEHGHHRGLGWINGHVVPIPPSIGLRVPHVGWSEVGFNAPAPLFNTLSNGTCFYFDHSFHLECSPEIIIAKTNYRLDITAAIRQDNIFATQFHPEKSQRAGLKLLRNFLNFCDTNHPTQDATTCQKNALSPA